MYVVAFLKLKYMCVIREVGQIPELLWKRMSRREFFFYPKRNYCFIQARVPALVDRVRTPPRS